MDNPAGNSDDVSIDENGVEIISGTPEWLEYDSTINLRPPGNRSRDVRDPATRACTEP